MLGNGPRAKILLEASTESEWVARHLESLGHEVLVADPNYAPMYATRSRRTKTDRRDARTLMDACQTGAYRLAHRLSDPRRHVRAELAVRDALIRTRLLAEAPEPVALSELATHSKCMRSNITQLMDRLERDGLVRRVADPVDRRVRRAALTAAGRKAHEEATRIIDAQERAVAAALSREEAKALAQALGRLAS